MTVSSTKPPERIHELLADRATQVLTTPEEFEMNELLETYPELDAWTYDRIAAAIDLSIHSVREMRVSEALRRRLIDDAGAYSRRRAPLAPSMVESTALPRPRTAHPGGTSTVGSFRLTLPWLAAAAAILLAVVAWWPSGGGAEPAEAYAALSRTPGSVVSNWQTAIEGESVAGSLVWNTDRQEGYMRFRGLAVNDPMKVQYQLWIFDAGRQPYSADIAVDGGVFDIDAATGDVYVPVRAALEVFEPTLFAITTEPPGGVVKHNAERDPERYRIVLTAPADA